MLSQDVFRFLPFKMAVLCFYFTVRFTHGVYSGKMAILIKEPAVVVWAVKVFSFFLEVSTDWSKSGVVSQLQLHKLGVFRFLNSTVHQLWVTVMLLQVLQDWKESGIFGHFTRSVCFPSFRSRSLTQHRVWTSTTPIFHHWEEPSHWTAGQQSQSWQ